MVPTLDGAHAGGGDGVAAAGCLPPSPRGTMVPTLDGAHAGGGDGVAAADP
jgi:hypothetical protein